MPLKVSTNFFTLMEEYTIWSNKNFGPLQVLENGYKYAHQPLLGIFEEIGELDNVIKNGSTDQSSDICDAVGDIMIFMLDYCRCMYIPIEEITNSVCAANYAFMNIIGELAHHHLKLEQNIRGTKDLHRKKIMYMLQALFTQLVMLARTYYLDFDECLAKTWNIVKMRDWTKNRANGEVKE